MAGSLTFGKASLEADRHLTPALERLLATLAAIELRQSRFDHFQNICSVDIRRSGAQQEG
jgi:hypothetical protein